MEEFEIWKDIEGYEGLYQVSNMGRMKSLERVVVYSDGRKYTYPERILKLSKDKDGYLLVGLWKNRKGKKFRTHRLVALAFIPNKNPIEKTEINHLDENKENNHVDNLEWVSPKENSNYGSHNEKLSKSKKGKGIKPIIQLDLQNNFIRVWESATQVEKELNIKRTNICMCCKGKQNQCGGYKWVYKSDYKPTNTQLELNFD